MLDPVEFFEPGGALAQAHPGYEARPGQARMAAAVARTLEQGGVLLVEAGTGTGKTLAYLLPAIASGRRVIVSTGTRNLQDQIATKELPFLRERLKLDVSAALMKGRDNYLCRLRLGEMLREPLLEDAAEAPWLERLASWSASTETGDRSEVADLPDRLKLWQDVNAKADTCIGTRCPEFDRCWLTRMKRRAADSQIVVVNHHLFFADLVLRSEFGTVLPEYDTVVFDVAHLLEDVATLYFGVQASSGQVEDLAREAERLAARAGGPSQGGGGAGVLRQAARDFFGVLRERLRDQTGRVRFEPPSRGGPDLAAEWQALATALDEVARQAAALPSGEDRIDSVPRRAQEAQAALTSVLARDDASFVYGMELRGRGSVMLTAAPIDVAEPLRARLFDPLQAAVLTSATLTVEDSFGFFKRRLGLPDAETALVDSGFDHAAQAVLYLPAGLPEPAHPGFLDRAVEEIVALLEITAGRAFLLFTSYAALERVREALEHRARWPLFVQGSGSKVALVESFRTTPGAVLLGTTSFWHGVDVPGAALSLVVIDRLPFDVPSDPLVAARIDRIRRAGGNPFEEYQVPMAVLELKQGLGRLLRSREDRGILAVLDPRLETRRYGRTFLRSLPPYTIVRDRRACETFFRGAAPA